MGIATSIADNIVAAQKEVQKEMQKEMQEIAIKNQLRAQERMRRTQMAMQVAVTRDRLHWMAGTGGVAVLGLLGHTLRGGRINAAIGAPIFIYSALLAYQWDLAYGRKAHRIEQYFEEVTSDPTYPFNPLFPDEPPVQVLRERKGLNFGFGRSK
eukprot:TRINITY_DN1139_c0_g1_i1.p1 TRINITY_DN1139_c0_g1~~TRINITY_DN1139_c0_g1_i1.p1  ORF type:complete len:154 (-),score=19.45 TRINITY_DN1139_c0_g1_i1:10-471(-)